MEHATEQDRAIVLGKIAHIVLHSNKPGEPRFDASFPKELLDQYENWILLCARDHDMVDGQPNTYTVVELRRWKDDHESWVRQRLSAEIPSITFTELRHHNKPSDHASSYKLMEQRDNVLFPGRHPRD